MRYFVLRCTVCEGEGAIGYGDFRSGMYPASKLLRGETMSACHNCGGQGEWRIPLGESNESLLSNLQATNQAGEPGSQARESVPSTEEGATQCAICEELVDEGFGFGNRVYCIDCYLGESEA